MKKTRLTAIILTLAILAGLTASLPVGSTAADNITVIVDGKTIRFPDAPAFVDGNGRTQIPVRYVGEAMGMLVQWENKARRATFSMEMSGLARHVDFYIGSDVFYVKDAPDNIPVSKKMNTTAFVRDSRTYVPVRYLAEAFGATVQWDSATRTVVIESSADAAPLPPAAAPAKPGPPEYPTDGSQFDEDGYFLAEYANAFYDQLLDSLRITYEGDKVFLSYTMPEGVPEDAELMLSIVSRSLDEYVMVSDLWFYCNFERRAGDREAGDSHYLMPNPVSGDVLIEMDYIPYEYLRYIDFWCGMTSPRNGIPGESRRFAQSSYRMFLYPRDPQESILRKYVNNKWDSHIRAATKEINVDISKFVVFK